jgi:WD40 repeat protein
MSTAAQFMVNEQNPWPGLGAFDEASEHFFNGRNDEIAELRRLVVNGSLTVLFGASGLGKTSLIQAGLFPSSRRDRFFPIYIRLDVRDNRGPLIDQAKLAFEAALRVYKIDAPPFREHESLWEYLHRPDMELWSPLNYLLTPLFVFDQFEEAFTLGAENPAAVKRLRVDLADLIENRVPDTLAKAIHADDHATANLALDKQRYRIVLSFREDFLPAVESWKRDLPSILRNRLRLLPMSEERAFEAIYRTAPHLVDERLAHEIVEFVAGARENGTGQGSETTGVAADLNVEPALLSLVCHGLNEKRKALGKDSFDEDLLAGSKQSIVRDFYANAVHDLSNRVQDFIGKELITARGFRKPCDVDDARTLHGVTGDQLRLLVDRRILRIEPYRGTERVELTHDLLTGVVREERDRRESLKRRRKLLVASASIVLAVVGFTAWYQDRREKADQLAAAEAQTQHQIEDGKREAALEKAQSDAKFAQEKLAAQLNLDAVEWRSKAQLLASKAEIVGTEGESALRLSLLLAAESMRRQFLSDNRATLSRGLPLLPKPLGSLPISSNVVALTFGKHGQLVTREPDTVRVWNSISRSQLREFSAPGTGGFIGTSNDGGLLGIVNLDNQQSWIRVYNLETGALDGQRKVEGVVTYVYVGKEGNLTALIGNALHHWKNWSDDAGALPETLKIADLLDAGGAIAVNSDQTRVALLDPDQSQASIHDLVADKEKAPSWQVGQADDITFDPSDSNRLISFERGTGSVKIWNVARRDVEVTLHPGPGPFGEIHLSADGRLLATSGADGTIKIWNTRDGPEIATLSTDKVASVAVDGANSVVAFIQNGSVQLWQVGELPLPDVTPIKKLLGIAPSLHFAAGTCGDTQTFCVVRFENNKPREVIGQFKELASLVGGLTFSANGRFLAGGFRKYVRGGRTTETVTIWDISTGERLSPDEPAPLLGFTPDSNGVILRRLGPDGKSPGSVAIWDLQKKTFRTERPKTLTKAPINIAFSSDGHWLAASYTGSGPNCANQAAISSPRKETDVQQHYCVSTWHWPDGRGPAKTIQIGAKMGKMSLNADGHYLLTSAGEPFLRVWDLKNKGEEAGRVDLYRREVPLAMEFSEADRRVVVFDRFSMTNSPWQPDDVLKEVCQRVGRSLTKQEWDEYLPDEKGMYVSTCKKQLASGVASRR